MKNKASYILLSRKRFLQWVVAFCMPLISFSQVSIPDTAFLDFIKSKYPSAIDANNKLIISEALKINAIYYPYGKVKTIEGIQYFKNLKTLAVYKSTLSHIPNLDSLTQLQRLIIYENQLDSIPSLKKIAKLTNLTAYSNKLKTLPELPDICLLDTLSLGLNLFENIDAVADLKNLVNFGAWNCKLKTAPDLSQSIHLKSISLGSNLYIETIPGLSKLTELEYIDFDRNHFSQLPDLTANVNLKKAKFFQNQLTFGDLLPNINHPYFSNFEYAPQDSIGNSHSFAVYEGESFLYDFNIDKTISSNVYRLYKNDILIDSNKTGSISFSKITLADQGSYRFEIVNTTAALSKLKLHTRPIYISVIPLINASSLRYSTENINCNELGSAKIDLLSIVGGTSPYTAKLISSIGKDTVTAGSNGLFLGLQEEDYDLIITDVQQKKLVLPKKINIKANYEECKPLVITPDGDGNNDELYLAYNEKIRIFDKQGLLINELNGPNYWKATNTKGETVSSGYYVIRTTDASIKVYVVW